MFLSTGHGEFYGIPHQRPQRSTIDEKKMLLWDEIINCNAVFDMFEHHKIQLCACIVCFEGMHGRAGKDSTAHFCQLDKKYISPFAQSSFNFLNFKLTVERSTQ